jgi:hypothetical protein
LCEKTELREEKSKKIVRVMEEKTKTGLGEGRE